MRPERKSEDLGGQMLLMFKVGKSVLAVLWKNLIIIEFQHLNEGV